MSKPRLKVPGKEPRQAQSKAAKSNVRHANAAVVIAMAVIVVNAMKVVSALTTAAATVVLVATIATVKCQLPVLQPLKAIQKPFNQREISL